MITRCKYACHKSFKNYGGRGIFYIDKWATFRGFWEDMSEGYADQLTLDRIDNNKGYYKENCRWATKSLQERNKRRRLGVCRRFIGVEERPPNKFIARCRVEGRQKYLGTFKTGEEAATVYDNKCEELGCGRPNGTTRITGE